MGMDQKVCYPPEKTPSWPRLVEYFAAKQFPIDMRMIDGELAFPDEQPPDNWRELRIGTPGGMITLRRETDGITLVVWGNADETLRAAWNMLAKGLTELTGGDVQTQT